jgi:osmotically-inducible protein OsmY
MKSLAWWLPAALCAASLLQGCELALLGAGSATAYAAYEDRRTSGMQIDDEAIEMRAQARVGDRFADKVHLNVNAYNRTVLLTGEAPDEATRAEIEKIVRAVPNVRAVTNEMQIAPISTLGDRANDSLLTTHIKARFLHAKRFNPMHVKVATEAGVVYLLGLVTDREADDAVEIARRTGGVRKVVKIFEYCKSIDSPCRPSSAGKTAP